MDKKVYVDPKAEKLEFDYDEVVRTSGGAKAPGNGCSGGCKTPCNCSQPIVRKQSFWCWW